MQEYTQQAIEEEVKKLVQSQKSPNIFLCGKTGAGKDSLINFLFNENVAHPNHLHPQSIKGFVEYYPGSAVGIYNSMGYEIGQQEEYRTQILTFLKKQETVSPDKRAHIVWYTINAAQAKYTEFDLELIHLFEDKNLPVCVLLTKIDDTTNQGLESFTGKVRQSLPQMAIFYTSSKPGGVQQFCQWDELIHWTNEHLGEAFRCQFVASLRAGLAEKRKEAEALVKSKQKEFILGSIIPLLTATLIGILRIYNIEVDGENLQRTLNSKVMMRMGDWCGKLLDYLEGLAPRIPLLPKLEPLRKWLPFIMYALRKGVGRIFPTFFLGKIGKAFIVLCEKQAQDLLDGKEPSFDMEALFQTADYGTQLLEQVLEEFGKLPENEQQKIEEEVNEK